MPERGNPKFLKDAIVALRDITNAFDQAEIGVSNEAATEFFTELDKLTVRADTSLPTRIHPDADPHARSEREREIERSLRITQHSVDSAPIGIFRLDADGHVVSANEAACRSLGYTQEELQALTIYDIDPNFTPEIWRAHRTRTRESGGRTLQSTHRRKDGSVFPIEVIVKQVLFNGSLFSVSFVRNISERIQADQERKRLEERMLEAQKLESLGVLAGGIAHDFNNLLMVILGNLDLTIRDLPESSSVHPMLDDMNSAARQATDLCRQLLIYAGKGESVMYPTNLGALLRAQAQMLEVSASKSIRLVIETNDNLPQILADASQLRQVFMNLIINASDAIGDSPGVITLTTGIVDCDIEYLENLQLSTPLKPGQYVFAEVTDTGCGMTEVVRSKIFDPFFSTKTTGRGLGLAAVRGIIHNHGGAIRIYSEVGKGTTFKLLFPVPESLAFDTQPCETAPQSWQGHGVVLLVDDEASLRQLGIRMLERLGFDVITASNGLEAITAYETHRERIAFVLLDWTMPEMGGGDALRELKTRSPNVRVVVASGHAPSDLARRLRDQGVAAFVRKPYHLEELSRALQEASRLPVNV